MSETMNTGELIDAVCAVERELRRIEHRVGELVQAAFAMRAEDAETIRQLRRELEEVRHGDE